MFLVFVILISLSASFIYSFEYRTSLNRNVFKSLQSRGRLKSIYQHNGLKKVVCNAAVRSSTPTKFGLLSSISLNIKKFVQFLLKILTNNEIPATMDNAWEKRIYSNPFTRSIDVWVFAIIFSFKYVSTNSNLEYFHF
jgi:hypothetical protein